MIKIEDLNIDRHILTQFIFVIGGILISRFESLNETFEILDFFLGYDVLENFFNAESVFCDWKEWKKVEEFYNKYPNNSYILNDGTDSYTVFTCNDSLLKFLDALDVPYDELSPEDWQ